MNYKYLYKGQLLDSTETIKELINKKQIKVERIYPKIKDNPTALLDYPENATEEQIENIDNLNNITQQENIEYMVKEYV